MVIVGFSEENNFYIVRNSWGPEFGEDGYCYIPTAYIDDPDYMDFACIITEISDNAGGQKQMFQLLLLILLQPNPKFVLLLSETLLPKFGLN